MVFSNNCRLESFKVFLFACPRFDRVPFYGTMVEIWTEIWENISKLGKVG